MKAAALSFLASQSLAVLLLSGCAAVDSDDSDESTAEASAAIMGGQRDTTGTSALLYRRDVRNRVVGLCSAVQIAPIMLTAAHCVTPSPSAERFSVRFITGGEVEFDNAEDPSSVPVVALAVDPQFRRTNRNLGHDVAVLRLAAPGRGVVFDINRAPITPAWFGAKARLSGYGAPDGTLTGYSPLRRTVETTLNGFQVVGQRTYPGVLRFGKSGTGACTGDDGGPALVESAGSTLVVGLSSFVESRTRPDAPGVVVGRCVGESRYTRVDESAPFIDGTRAAWGE